MEAQLASDLPMAAAGTMPKKKWRKNKDNKNAL